jgi:hypothetical protein
MHVSLTQQQGRAAHTQTACTTPHTTVTTSTHNPLIMASSSSPSDWECRACVSSNEGGKYCAMCNTPRPKCQALLTALAADVAVHAAVFAVPAAVGKAIPSAPTPRAVISTPAENCCCARGSCCCARSFCFHCCCHRRHVFAAAFS